MFRQKLFILLSLCMLQIINHASAQKSRVGVYAHWDTDKLKTEVALNEYNALLPKEAFKSINYPVFYNRRESKDAYKDEGETMIVVVQGKEQKAYPLNILMYHQVINDRIAGIPIAVTYCPLTDAVNVLVRNFNQGDIPHEVDMRVSGMIRGANTILFDKQTESWWQQFTGEALTGEFAGVRLASLPAARITLKDYYQYFPYGMVMSNLTVNKDLPYGTNPYFHYEDISKEKPLLLDRFPEDDRLRSMERVITVDLLNQSLVYPLESVESSKVINDQPLDMYLTIFFNEGIPSALDHEKIQDGMIVGSAAAYSTFHNGQLLTFYADGEHYKDSETSSTWNFMGKCIEGTLKGDQLKPLFYTQSFAFPQLGFYPESKVFNIDW